MCLGVRVGLVIGIVLVDRVKCFLETLVLQLLLKIKMKGETFKI